MIGNCDTRRKLLIGIPEFFVTTTRPPAGLRSLLAAGGVATEQKIHRDKGRQRAKA
jgi:hypothetical protein